MNIVKKINPYKLIFWALIVTCALFAGLAVRAIQQLEESVKQTRDAVVIAGEAQLELYQLKQFAPQAEKISEELPEEEKTLEFVVEIPAEDIEYLANVTWGEARGCSKTEQAAVMWCVLNRVDSEYYPDTVKDVVTQRKQFHGYNPNNPLTEELLDLAKSVLTYYYTGDETGRVLPETYLYFVGDGFHNYFYTEYMSDKAPWDWSLTSPYEMEVTDYAE